MTLSFNSTTNLNGNIFTAGNSSFANLLISDYISIFNIDQFILSSSLNLNMKNITYVTDFEIVNEISYFGNSIYPHNLSDDDYIFIFNSNIFIDEDATFNKV